MNKRTFLAALAAFVFSTATGGGLPAQVSGEDSAKLIGKWAMTSTVSDGTSVEWSLEIKQGNSGLTGTVSGEEGPTPAKDFKVDGTKVTFKTTYHDQDYQIELALKEDKLSGKWSGESDSGTTTGVRAPTDTPAK